MIEGGMSGGYIQRSVDGSAAPGYGKNRRPVDLLPPPFKVPLPTEFNELKEKSLLDA